MLQKPNKGLKLNPATKFKKGKSTLNGAKSRIGKGPGSKTKWAGTDSSQFNLRSYFCPEEKGTPLGVATTNDV